MNTTPSSRRRRGVRLASVLAAAALLLAACGGDDDTGDEPAAETTATTAPTQPRTTEPGATDAPASSTDPATTTAAPPGDAQRGGTLTVALSTDPISLQPRGGGAGNDQLHIARQLFDSLLDQDPDTGEFHPWLAESWEVNADASEYTFHLRDDVTFSDGTPLTAELVKNNFDDVVASGAKATWVIGAFAGYEASTVVDEHTLTVTFSSPNAPFLQATATQALGIVGQATLDVPFEDRATSNLVGSGPFVLDHYTAATEAVLVRRDGYAWAPERRANQGEAYVDEIVFKFVPEAGVRTGALTSGQVDVVLAVPPTDIETLRDAGYSLIARQNPGIVFGLSPVNDHSPLDDVSVRQAIAAGIDAADVQATVFTEEFPVATSVLAHTTPGYSKVDTIAYDPEHAGELLDAAGWTLGSGGIREKDGKKLHLVLGWLNNFGPNQTALELIQAQLLGIGVEIELVSTTGPEFQEKLGAGAFDLVWANSTRADGDVLRASFSSTGTNYYKIDDPELEALLQKQLATSDPAARNDVLADVQARIVEQGYQIPVFEYSIPIAADASVHGFEQGADSRLEQLADVWIES